MADLALADGPLLLAILGETHKIWSEGLAAKPYYQWYMAQLGTPWGSAHLRRIALVEGTEVLASAKEYTFAAMLDGTAIRVVGLGAVFTQPAHRGRGAAHELLE